MKQKPFLCVPCQARTSGVCPDQESATPDCHICASADASAQTLSKVGPSLGFQVDYPKKYSGLGCLSQNIRHIQCSTGGMTFRVDGDQRGTATIFIHEMRHAANSRG